MDNPWGSAWSEPEKDIVQEVTLKPKAADSWLTSPASGDLGVAWSSSSQWDAKTDAKTTWKPTATTFASGSTPWESPFEARAAEVLGFQDTSASLEPTPVKGAFQDQSELASTFPTSPQSQVLNVVEESYAEDPLAPDDLPNEEEKPDFTAPFDAQEEESEDTWRALGNAAITVGNDADWETAWKPESTQEDAHAESPIGPPDDWAEAVQQRVLRDAKVPPEVMEMIFSHYRELEKTLWLDEDLETAREGPAPRAEWQGGLENVDGLTALVNQYLPPNTSAPPIHFGTTKIATSLQNAMRLTKSYGMIQKSPLNQLIRTSESWEQSVRSGRGGDTAFSLEAWLARRGTSALSIPSPFITGTSEPEKKAVGLLGTLSRSSIDPGRYSSSASSTPRASQDGLPSMMSVTAAATTSSLSSPTGTSFSTGSPAQTAAPSAVSRFLGRFSRKVDDAPKPPTPVNLRPDELDFLDMVPAMNPNGAIAGAIQKELENAGGYPGAVAMGSSIISTPTPSRRGMLDPRPVNKLTSSVNLSQITSKDFDAIIDSQIMEVEDEMMRESLIAAAMISGPSESRYSGLHMPLFGSRPPNGAQLLSNSGSAQSNTLLDDDDFEAFLSSSEPPKPSTHARNPSQPPFTNPPPFFFPPPSLFSTQNMSSTFTRATSPPNVLRPGSKVSPTPSRSSTVAIMSQSGASRSRPSTPSTMNIAPLLPPPPGSKPIRETPTQRQGDLLNDPGFTSSSAQTPSLPSNTTTNGANTAQMGNLFALSPPKASAVPNPTLLAAPKVMPSPTPAPGGLSAQELSFFEGL